MKSNLFLTHLEIAGKLLVRVLVLMKNQFIRVLRIRKERIGHDSPAALSENLRFRNVILLLTPSLTTNPVCGIRADATVVVIASVFVPLSQRTRENATKWEFTFDGDQRVPAVSLKAKQKF